MNDSNVLKQIFSFNLILCFIRLRCPFDSAYGPWLPTECPEKTIFRLFKYSKFACMPLFKLSLMDAFVINDRGLLIFNYASACCVLHELSKTPCFLSAKAKVLAKLSWYSGTVVHVSVVKNTTKMKWASSWDNGTDLSHRRSAKAQASLRMKYGSRRRIRLKSNI